MIKDKKLNSDFKKRMTKIDSIYKDALLKLKELRRKKMELMKNYARRVDDEKIAKIIKDIKK